MGQDFKRKVSPKAEKRMQAFKRPKPSPPLQKPRNVLPLDVDVEEAMFGKGKKMSDAMSRFVKTKDSRYLVHLVSLKQKPAFVFEPAEGIATIENTRFFFDGQRATDALVFECGYTPEEALKFLDKVIRA